jgi:excisionase family DNA binding protein
VTRANAEPLFVRVPEVAAALGLDVRTVRRSIKAGEIPAKKHAGAVLIPTEWLQQQTAPSPAPTQPQLPLDELADLVAEKVVARLGRALFGLAPRGTGPPGPAAADSSHAAASSPPRNGAA